MPRLSPGITPAVVGTVIGPTAVALYELGGLHLFRAMPLLNVWVVVAVGGFGVWAGVRALRTGFVVVGVLCLLANGVILGRYGATLFPSAAHALFK